MKRIESTQNALVKHWKKLVTLRKEREKTEEFIRRFPFSRGSVKKQRTNCTNHCARRRGFTVIVGN